MNNVSLVGRLAKDPEVRYTQDNLAIARFTLAVSRRKANEADFLNITAFGKTAEFVEKYFHKGMRMGLNGRIQTGSYTNQEGKKVYTTEVVADNVEFVESKTEPTNKTEQTDDFMEMTDGMENLPFN